tara:strand:+ start:193 stop:432 length:240 start_codon:yes stop_codon:yes gene_type:complete
MTYFKFEDERIEGVLAVDENSPSENGVIDWLIDNKIKFKTITAFEYNQYECKEVEFEIRPNRLIELNNRDLQKNGIEND